MTNHAMMSSQGALQVQGGSASVSNNTGLLAEDIDLSFGAFKALKGVSLQLHPGEIHALTGENGAGKSSLAKVIAGIYPHDAGQILLNGVPVRLRNPREALNQGIALIHQEPITFTDLSVAENILAGHLPKRFGFVDWSTAYQRSQELLDRLGWSISSQQKATGLSIADQQMLELAAALAHSAKVWIFDETTAPLTPTEVQRLFGIIRELKAQGCAIAIVTHHLEEVFAISDRITVLRDGEKIATLDTATTSPPEVVRLMVGRELSNDNPASSSVSTEPIVKIQNLTGKGFSDISFEINRGEIFALAGLVGAGRTELARALFGVTSVQSGDFLISGKSAVSSSPCQAVERGIALVPEDRHHDGLLLNRSISENASLSQIRTVASRIGIVNRPKEASRVDELMDRLQTAMRSKSQTVGSLSGGNQQKVVLAKWLFCTPEFLILDEPTRGVDIGAKSDFHAILRELAKNGIPILLISSDLPEVLALAHRIGVMRRGRLERIVDREFATEELILGIAAGEQQ